MGWFAAVENDIDDSSSTNAINRESGLFIFCKIFKILLLSQQTKEL